MDKQPPDSKEKFDEKEKIVLPVNLQREMIKFFLRASSQKIAEAKKDKEDQQTSPNSNNAFMLIQKERQGGVVRTC